MLFEARQISVEYTSLGLVNRAVNNVDVDLGRGEVLGVVGESGCGKSTLALALLGLTRPGAKITSGSIKLDDVELLAGSQDMWKSTRGAKIGLVTQNPRASLNPTMRIGRQISTVYQAHTQANAKQARAATIAALQLVGMNDPERRYDAYPHELSGGMAQRALIAMATVTKPTVVIADEPTSRLDVTIQAQILDDLVRAVGEVGSALVLITQDLGVVANYADRVYVLHAGEVVEVADTTSFFDMPTHPTSISLLASELGTEDGASKLIGLPVDGRHLPEVGCWLQGRCPYADERSGCLADHPGLSEVGAGHLARCHRWAMLREKRIGALR
jgi:oligopeptide/dipeptide ABC transporter ATP-binding protein